jgi:endonuclease V-like protein UPF0215 family
VTGSGGWRARLARVRPHLIGIDDGPFEKDTDAATPIVGVVMEGSDLVEGVAMTSFPIDGAGVTEFLTEWVQDLRFRPGLQGVVLGGITIAGLAVIDVERLSEALRMPVLVVNRKDPRNHRLAGALRSAGLADRLGVVDRTPPSLPLGGGLHFACAGATPEEAAQLIDATRRKGEMPEPLRLAHLIASAVVRGQSRGRV